MLQNAIDDGSALKKLADLVSAQHGDSRAVYDTSLLPDARLKLEVPCERSGYVSHIQAEQVGLVSMHLGGGRATKESEIDLAVGAVLHKKVGDVVHAGESLATIYANDAAKGREAVHLLRGCYSLSDEAIDRPVFIKGVVR